MKPIVLFGIQFTLSLVAYSLIARWYVAPRLAGLPREPPRRRGSALGGGNQACDEFARAPHEPGPGLQGVAWTTTSPPTRSGG